MRAAFVGLLAVTLVAPLAAQERPAAPDWSGFGPYVRVGAGALSSAGECEGCEEWQGSGFSLSTELGWRISRRFGVGVTVDGGDRTEGQIRERHGHLAIGPRFDVTPRATIHAGIGSIRVRQDVALLGDDLSIKGSGTGWQVGGGYQFPLGSRVLVTPGITYRASSAMDLSRDGDVLLSGYSYRSIEVGVSLTWTLQQLLWPTPRDIGPD